MANQAVLEKVFADEAFVKQLVEMEKPEDVRDALNAKGAEVTTEEVQQIAKSLSQQAEGELDEDALEDVAGGVSIGTIISAARIGYDLVRTAIRRRW